MSDPPYLETAVQIVSEGSRVEVVVQCGTFRLNIPKIEIWRQYKNLKSNNNLLLTNTFYPMNKCLNENLNLISNNTHSTECSLYWVAISFPFAFEKGLVILINILIYWDASKQVNLDKIFHANTCGVISMREKRIWEQLQIWKYSNEDSVSLWVNIHQSLARQAEAETNTQSRCEKRDGGSDFANKPTDLGIDTI